ncbi:MAG: response regulator transcription factor, partial [Thiohalomonadales bacterium]
MKNILVVEDNTDIANLVSMHLKDLDANIQIADTGTKGMHQIENDAFDLVILDIMLPGMDGIEICRRVRQQDNYTPILMLTSKSSELDRVVGLEVGADDYLTKPFSVRE